MKDLKILGINITEEFKNHLNKLQVISSETLTGCGEFEDTVMNLMEKLELDIDELVDKIKEEIKGK